MTCPYCGRETEKGIVYLDRSGSTVVVYKSEDDARKKGLFPGIDPLIWIKYASDKEEAYRCKSCKKVIVILPE